MDLRLIQKLSMVCITCFILFTLSCKKTASDIDTTHIKTSCDWLKAYDLTVNEYYDYISKQHQKYQAGVKNGDQFRKRIDKKRKLYDQLLSDLYAIQFSHKDINGTFCDSTLREQLDQKYSMIYDSLLPGLSPNYVAEGYLQALMNKDYDHAKRFADKQDYDDLDMLKELKADLGITHVTNVNCPVEEDRAKCTFCCTTDTNWKELKLFYHNGKWKIVPSKESPPPEE